MQFQEPKVLLSNRWISFKNFNDKEWWYTGICDQSQNLFIGISAIRTKFVDSIDLSIYFADEEGLNVNKDKSGGHWVQASFMGFIKTTNEQNKLDLSVNRGNEQKSFYFDYTDTQGGRLESESCNNKWNLAFASKKAKDSNKNKVQIKGSFTIEQVIPRFTKYNNFFCNTYTLLHYFQNKVCGTLTVNGKEYVINNALGYQDHCFGTVPRKTKWHWIAVQGKDCALASLMNYGSYAQQYTEAYFGTEPSKNNWIRLNQDVSFECYEENRFLKHWRITSPDIDLRCKTFSWNNQNNFIPPIINLQHYECYVKVEGRIKVNNEWKPTGKMYGVLEEHFGIW